MRICYIALFFISLSLLSNSCRKELFTDDPSVRLSFSTDTVHFDTVFVTIGSATKNFKVTNTENKAVKVNVRLAGGANSPFRINVDGRATTSFPDLELAAGDSMYVFVEVTIDPNNPNIGFVVQDSILFETNGNTQKIILDAFGQKAHFFDNETLECNAVWTNDMPYVIYNSVAVKPGCKLSIEKGVKIYSHKNSGIFIYGALEINGTKDEPVTFFGDRLEKEYADIPGQWYGIELMPFSQQSTIKHAVIQNAIIGIQADSLPTTSAQPNLIIENTIIRNMLAAGIAGMKGSAISGKNLLIHSCEQYTFLGFGGDYKFTNCTFDNSYTKTARRDPSFALTNFYVDPLENVFYADLNAQFRNCIIWGNQTEEMVMAKKGPGTFDTLFRYNIVKTKGLKFGETNLPNKHPRFENAFSQKYALDTLSPAIDAGIYFPGEFEVKKDLLENNRDAKPDLGCYEYAK